MLVDAAQFLQIYDTDLIYSWTPREFKNFIKGAQLRKIDDYEASAVSAIFNAKVKNKRKVKLKDIYDADKARKEIESDGKPEKQVVYLDHWKKAQEAMKSYGTKSVQEGG